MSSAAHRRPAGAPRTTHAPMPGLFGPLNPPFADYRGRRVWVIGASYGIGAAIARELLARGAQVALSARSRSLLQGVADGHADALVTPLDVTDVASVHAAAKVIERAWGGFDLALVVAGTHAEMRARAGRADGGEGFFELGAKAWQRVRLQQTLDGLQLQARHVPEGAVPPQAPKLAGRPP